jgi:hypothetical protein
VLATEFNTRTTSRTLVRYRDFLENWQEVVRAIEQDLGMGWPARSPAVDAEIQRFVNPDLRNHDAEINTEVMAPALADWIQRTSSALEKLHTRDVAHEVTAWNDLDGVRRELDRATDISESRLLALHRRIDDLQAELDQARSERAGLEHQVHALEVQSAERLRVLVEAQQDAEALRASISWRLTSPLRVAGRIFR